MFLLNLKHTNTSFYHFWLLHLQKDSPDAIKKQLDFGTVFKQYNKIFDAGWSSLVARRAHNPKAVGSNPAPATIKREELRAKLATLFCLIPELFAFCFMNRMDSIHGFTCLNIDFFPCHLKLDFLPNHQALSL